MYIDYTRNSPHGLGNPQNRLVILHTIINDPVFLFVHFHSLIFLQYQPLRFSFH